MNFSEVIKEKSTHTHTENGAFAYNTTGDKLIDLFSTIGALRTRSEEEICEKFEAAFNENEYLATKILFYCGNIRGGLGERRTFRICLKWLAENYPEIVEKNIYNIPLFNRWDSLFELIGTGAEGTMWNYIIATLTYDLIQLSSANKNNSIPKISLLAKWLPSENASSKKTCKLAKKIIEKLEISPKEYRKILSALRGALKIVEKSMSAGDWNNIVYEGVPSYAMKNYRKAFERHDPKGFSEFIKNVVSGEQKINASTLYPYDLIHEYTGGYDRCNKPYDEVIEQQWKSLPNYVEKGENILVMADVSGSMYGRPMESSVGLAIYMAQRNSGHYHNKFMTFTSEPTYFYIDDNASLKSIINKVVLAPWGFNTDLTKAMKTILADAINNGVKPEEMPKALLVITDMEIDNTKSPDQDYSYFLKDTFEKAGYKLPKLIFWNVDSRKDTFLTKDFNTILVSGQSPSTFKNVIKGIDKNAYEIMLDTLNDPMYDCVRI